MCVFVCVHVCVCACMFVCQRACVFVCLFISVEYYVCVFTFACTRVRLCVHMCLCKNICACVFLSSQIGNTPYYNRWISNIHVYTCIVYTFFFNPFSFSLSLSLSVSLTRSLALAPFLARTRSLPINMLPFKYIPSKNRTCFLTLAPWQPPQSCPQTMCVYVCVRARSFACTRTNAYFTSKKGKKADMITVLLTL